MKRKNPISKFLTWSARAAGSPITFIVAISFLAIWIFFGVLYGFSTTWLLTIDTVATVNAALMVFVIQNTQIRETKALHLKIDELIRVNKEAARELIAIEEMEEEELEQIRKKIFTK